METLMAQIWPQSNQQIPYNLQSQQREEIETDAIPPAVHLL